MLRWSTRKDGFRWSDTDYSTPDGFSKALQARIRYSGWLIAVDLRENRTLVAVAVVVWVASAAWLVLAALRP